MAPTSPRVAVIGSGFGGIAAAYRLKSAGADVTVFERADRVGGVWRENHYPGSACDVPSFLYSYSFAPKHDWSRRFAPQEEIQQYIEHTVDALGLRPLIRFDQELVAAQWHEDEGEWSLEFASGLRESVDILIAATGQMSTPNLPNVPGADAFEGASFHSARWDHEVDITDRDVVVVGTGASVIQIVPAIAATARRVTVIQRSPGYILEKGDHPYDGPQSRVGARLRRWQSYLSKELRTPRLIRWPALAAPAERRFRRDLERWIPDPVLRSKVMPDDRYGCKRILVSNEWYSTLQRPNVELLDDRVDHLSTHSVTTEGGVEIAADVVVYGTGFRTHAFLESVDIRGRDGLALSRAWEAGPDAYLGMAVPNFPNFFLMYGPNTNPAWNSVLVMLEWQASYLARVVQAWRRRGPFTMEVTASASASFSADMQKRSSKSVWVTGCVNWFTTATGRNTQNWPRMVTAYWWLTRRIAWADFHTRAVRRDAARTYTATV
ncbi:flavin-containing monooxygenase [uncultured Microbacterium sp.]|uniref:flavin-containing monooxygenase n=1 Tax=uncultured Microbacterium sp. TaxID=191216 RepID=UPI0035CBE556